MVILLGLNIVELYLGKFDDDSNHGKSSGIPYRFSLWGTSSETQTFGGVGSGHSAMSDGKWYGPLNGLKQPSDDGSERRGQVTEIKIEARDL